MIIIFSSELIRWLHDLNGVVYENFVNKLTVQDTITVPTILYLNLSILM